MAGTSGRVARRNALKAGAAKKTYTSKNRVERRTKQKTAAAKKVAVKKALPEMKDIAYKSRGKGGGLKSMLKKRTAEQKPMKKITVAKPKTKPKRVARSPRKTGGARRR